MCSGEAKRCKGNIKEGKTGIVLELSSYAVEGVSRKPAIVLELMKSRKEHNTLSNHQSETPIHSTLILIGSRQRLLPTVARTIAYCIVHILTH